MKLNAKLLVIAMIIAMIFSVSAIAATSENSTALSSEFTQVPHEQVVSVSEPTVPEVEATDLETSADNVESLSSSDNQVSIKDSDIKEESNVKKESEDSVLGISDDDEILAATRNVDGNTFRDLDRVIQQSQIGDIIDLQGKTLYGQDLSCYKRITIANGILESNLNYGGYTFQNCILENLTIKNLNTRGGTGINYCTLTNVHFDNCYADDYCTFAVRSCTLENVNFTNCHCVRPADPAEEDFESGVMIVTYYSKFNNCGFFNCSSNRHSGAICVAGQPGNVVNITNCKFDNCTSGVGGAVYLHGTGLSENLHSNIINCTFTNCHATEWGGALGSSQDYLNVENCDFINNTAKQGAAFMVGGITHGLDGDNSEGNYNIMKDCYFYNNTGSEEGGAVHITGHNNTALNCIFDDNFAVNGKGAAIYVKGDHGSVIDSLFTNHDSDMGTVYVEGDYFNCTHSTFEANHASHGGAGIYVEGNYTYVYDSEFRNNNASMHGGAIYTIGDHARILNSEFKYNNAIPNTANPDYGLGGAVYIEGNHNEISYSTFSHNTARNGSAIYNRGEDLHLNDDTFSNNQAWSYLLFTEAKPPEDYWSEDLQFLINITLEGGDNLINAIYNDWHSPTPHGVIDEIFFHNVTYTLKPNDLYPTGVKTTTDSEIHPVLGVENSHNGAVLYQDSREDDQLINVNMTYGDSKVFEYSGKTDMYGNILIAIAKENLTDGEFHPGVYNIYAHHPDDSQYTEIYNSTTFRVLPHVDVSVTKTSNKDVYIKGENAVFTITVSGVGTNATNVTVRDILPQSFKYVDSSASKNNYNPITNEWYIGFLPHGASETLKLIVKTTELGTFDNVVIVNCTERDWNLSNNRDNKTIHVNLYYTKEANVTDVSAGEYLEYYLRVYNIGNTDYTEEIQIRDVLPNGIKYTGEYSLEGGDLIRYVNHGDQQSWYVTNVAAGDYVQITIKCQALYDGVWNNTMYVWDYPPVNATVNVTHNADLRIIKTVSTDKVKKGDIINWTLTVINYGPSDASDVVVTDILPYGLEQYGIAIVPEGTDFYRESGKWVIGTLKVKETIQLIIPTRVTISGINITNEANVTSTTPDPNPDNNYDNETVEFYPDVSIQKIVSTKKTSHGEIITWTLVVTNNGPHTATGVYVIDRLPSGLRYANSKGSNGQVYNPSSGRWYIGDLAENETVTLEINTTVTAYDGFISNNATVYATNDGNPENNYAENFTEIITQADVGIVKRVSNQTSHYGDEIVWTVIVTNYGPNVAENVIVTDFMPAGLKQTKEPYKTKGQVYHLNGNGVWSIGNLAVNETVYLEFTTLVNVTDDTLINVVVVESTTEDPNPSNNRAENGTVVEPDCDVEVIKRVSNSTPNKYDEVTWTITIYNEGPNVAENVIVRDVLPNGLEFVTNSVPTKGMYHKDLNEWDVGTLEVGVRHTLNITTRVVDTGRITNEVNITTTTHDKNLKNNYDNETIDVPAIADLEIIKIVSDKNPKYGDLINWTITVTNKGPNNARNVNVQDKLPKGLIYVIHNATNGYYDIAQGIWHIGDLLHFHNETIVITTRVNITNATITNIAVVTSDTPDPDESNNKANNTTHVDPIADLAIGKFVSNLHPAYGEEFEYTIIVTNLGPDTAVNAYVYDMLPNGLIFISCDGDYDNNTGIWKIGNLSAEEGLNQVMLTIVVKSNLVSPTVVTNTANVTSETPDPDLTNNEDNVTIDIGHEADLEIIKIVSNKTSKLGDVITWTITVINHGPNPAVEAYVIDKLPRGLIYLSDDSNGKYDYETGIWNIGDLEVYSKDDDVGYAVLVITTRVNVTNANITNVANVTSDTYDPNETNNEANNTTSVDSFADLEVIKIVSDKNPHYGDIITWTITVINHGPNDAYNVNVTDKLPKGLIYKFDDSNGKYDYETGVWNIGTLLNGNRTTLVITTLVNITNATITNVAVVNSTTPDNNTENNKGNNTTSIEPEADLEIIKIVSNKTAKFGDVITWTIIVTNKGPDAAKEVYIRDNFPKELIFLGYTKTKGLFDLETYTWYIKELAFNETQNLTITSRVNFTNKTIMNIANVTSDTYDPNKTNNEANNTTEVNSKANLVVIKEVSKQNAKFGETITWTITVVNNGPDTAVNVRVNDTLPKGLIFVTSNGNYDNETGIWRVGNLLNGENKTLIITTIVNITNTTIRNVANVTSDTPGNRTPANNTTNVDPLVDLEIIKIVSNKTAKFGDVITWTIIVTNKGPDMALNVIVKDKLPNGLIYNGHKTETGLYDNVYGIWDIGNLAPNVPVNLTIYTIVNVSNRNITNIANVTSDTPDNNTDNNEANNTTSVNEVCDLEIIKIVSNKNPHKGDTITWTITVTNKGPNTAKNVFVTDKLPKGLIYVGSDGDYNPETGIWNVGDLEVDQPKSLIIITLVNITNKTITNIANVTSDTPDNNTDNNEANNTTNVSPEADLEIIKIVSNKNPHKGDTITWTITVTNKGPDTAVNVKVTDKLPKGLIYVGSDGDYNPETGIWNVGNLTSGEPKSLVITTIVNITNTTIRNVANATSETYDPNKTNNEGNNTTDVSPEADLEIVKLVSAKNTSKGEIITWTIIVTNKGPDAAVNIYVKDKMPKELVFKSYTKTKGLFDSDDLIWYISALAKGESAKLTIDTLVNVSSTSLINNVNVTNDIYDPNETNNEANNTTEVGDELPADLEIVKVVSNKNPHKGDTITWTITVTNHGPGKAIGVTVTDELPEGLKFVSSNGNYNKNTGVWTIGDLANGESKSLIITTLVTITNAEITNVAVVNSTTPDNNTENNKDNDTTNIDPEADVKVVKTVSNPKPSKGDVITWTIVVVNLGPDTAKDVVVSEKLPNGLRLISAKGSKGSFENDVWKIGELKYGEIATLTLTTKVLISGGTIENIVVVNSSTYDPNLTNNEDKEVVNPKSNSKDDDDEDDGGKKSEPNPNEDDDGDDIYDHPSTPVKYSVGSSSKQMHATGNPIVMALLALLAVAGVSLRRKD